MTGPVDVLTWRTATVAALLLVMGAAGCGKAPAPEPIDPPLARVGEVAITEEDFQFEIERRRVAGRPLGDAETILNDLIERQAMLQAAAQSQVLDDPVVRRELENRTLGQWLDRSLQIERDAVRVSDEDLRAHYEENIESHTRPGLIRVAILYRRTSPMDLNQGVEHLRAALDDARAAYLADPAAATQQGRLQGFGTVAAGTSEDTVSRHRGGDLGWLDYAALTNRLPFSIAEAGLALPPGEVSDVLVDAAGVYVIMKADERPPSVVPFEEVAPTLRRRLIREKQGEVERVFVSNLLAGTSVEINQEKMSGLHVPQSAMAPEPPVLRPPSDPGTAL